MGRAILGVIVGYFVMAVIIVACFTGLQLALGTERVFKPASYEASTLFIAVAVVVSLVAAMVAGLVCAVIARRERPVMVFAAIVAVLGIVSAAMNMTKAAPEPRKGDISPMEAAEKARQPGWYSWSLPVIGAAGVLLGGKLRKPVAVVK